MSEEYDFQKELKKSLVDADPSMDKIEMLEMIFSSYVTKLLEYMLKKSPVKGRLEASAINEAKRNLINEFRNAELGEWQRSVERYEEIYTKTIMGILNENALMNPGEDSAQYSQQLSIDSKGYQNIIAPKYHPAERVTPGGIILPG
jgi:hypothetical protein